MGFDKALQKLHRVFQKCEYMLHPNWLRNFWPNFHEKQNLVMQLLVCFVPSIEQWHQSQNQRRRWSGWFSSWKQLRLLGCLDIYGMEIDSFVKVVALVEWKVQFFNMNGMLIPWFTAAHTIHYRPTLIVCNHWVATIEVGTWRLVLHEKL